MTVAYLTDIEGMWEKLASFAAQNPLVSLEPAPDGGERLVVREGAVFVFGGDAVDRGPAGRRIMRTLLEARRRQPAQVVLLAGNRDMNKLRLKRELAGQPPRRTPEELKNGPRAELLCWIFEHTMGAKHAFEHRREELAPGLAGADADADEAVVESFVADVEPGGLTLDYLLATQLAYRHGATLFVHGGLGPQSYGVVPGEATPRSPHAVDVDEWAAALNQWYASRLGAGDWAPVIAYQAPHPGSRANPESVVYGRFADEHNNLRLPGAEVQASLGRAGVRRVVIGHTPSGDTPSILRDGGFELVCGDNSHARHRIGSKLFFDDDCTHVDARVHLDGSLDLLRLTFTARLDERGPLGRRTREGRLIKGPLAGAGAIADHHLGYRALANWHVEQLALPAGELGDDALCAPY